MVKYAQIVIGPAGSGKSTYCEAIHRHCELSKRPVHVVNLDPAAEHFNYPISIDIRDLISLDDAVEELNYGPNGGLVFCMEYLVENLHWLGDQIDDYENDYLIIDCPGQIELYSHLNVMKKVVEYLQKLNYNLCCVYMIDSLMIKDATRFFSGVLMCLSAMIQLETPHINIMSKCDLICKDEDERNKLLSSFFDPQVDELMLDINNNTSGKYRALNEAISTLITEYSMVSFLPLDITDEDSISLVLSHIDHTIQYGEAEEPVDPDQIEQNM